MITYISTLSKRIVGRNNNVVPTMQTDFDTSTSAQFQFVTPQNKIQDISFTSGVYFAGSVKMNPSADEMLWLCKDFTVEDNVLTFTGIDTYTSGYFKHIKKKDTPINVEIGIYDGDDKQVLLRDTALANPRVYLDEVDPHAIELGEYATREWIEEQGYTTMTPYELPVISGEGFFADEVVEWSTALTGKVEMLPWTSGAVMSFPTMQDASGNDMMTTELWVRIPEDEATGIQSIYVPDGYSIVNEDSFPTSLVGVAGTETYTYHIFVLRRGRGIVELTYSHHINSNGGMD